MAKAEKYLITETTVKKPKLDPRTGRDLRTAVERNGHVVSFRDNEGRQYMLSPQRPTTIVSQLNEGIINLSRGGFVKIEKIDDITTALAAHTLPAQPAKPTSAAVQKPAEDGEGGKDDDSLSRTRAYEMGKDPHEQRSGAELEGAVNPDGDPNFLVRATKGGPKLQKGKGSSKE